MSEETTLPPIPQPPVGEDDFAPVTEVSGANSSTSIFELADKYLKWREYKAELATLTKDANENIEKLEAALADRMIEDELQNFARGGKTFYLGTKTYASCRSGMKDSLIKWLEENGHSAIVGQTVNANTLASFVKEIRNDSETGELPDDLKELVNVFDKQSVNVRAK